MSEMASQITGVSIVCSTGADKKNHQSSASLAFVRGINWGAGDFPAQKASNADSIWWRHHVTTAPAADGLTWDG